MTDVRQQIDAVSRSLALEEVEGRAATCVVARQTYDADVEDVWDAITNPERIPRWFLPVSGDLRPGGRYQFEGNAGGTVLECDPPEHFRVTWEYGDEVTWVQVRLAADGPRTTVELRHTADVDKEKWAEFGPGAVGIGWDMALLGLSTHLGGPGGVRPEDAAAWVASDEGRRFMSLSGQEWCRADIELGTDEPAARAASERCIAAYTGG